jgi:hypothetical protein
VQHCSACGGPYHPATGHRWTESMVLCGRCALDWKAWLKAREAAMNRIKNGCTMSFAQAAITSIRPDGREDQAPTS